MDNSFEQSFKQDLEKATVEAEIGKLNNERKKYKILAFSLLAAVLILLVALISVVITFGNKAEVVEHEKCDCGEVADNRKTYGDFSLIYDEDGNVNELLMICKNSDGGTFELMEDFRYAERDKDANFIDTGTYSLKKNGGVMLELSSDRTDKYVYFDGRALINMDKIYNCIYE